MAEGIQIKNLPSTTTIKQGDTMTIVQDKQNKQLSLDVFANESDLGTLSPLENRCDEVKAKIEVDEYSAEITTSQSMSKIGSDDSGVDLHENVLDGAFESCVLKGKTKYRDIDTGEILEDFEEGRNLELITVRMPILTTVGKNLVIKPQHGYVSNGVINTSVKSWINSDYIYVKGLKEVVGSTSNVINGSTNIATYNKNKELIRALNGKSQATLNDDEYYVIFSRRKLDNSEITQEELLNSQMQLEIGSTPTTSYEPYKTNILTVNEDLELRGIGDVQDELDLLTGEVTERIGEIVLDGSEERWELAQDRTNTMRFNCYSLNIPYGVNGSLLKTDKLPYQSPTIGDQEGAVMGGGNTPKVVSISIMKAKLPSSDIDGFKQWLSQNPITIQYQLATESIKTVDVQGFPFSYENGHVILSSGSTEPSLTPTVTYKVPVSRVGQIASNTKSNLRQTIKLDQLEVLVYQSLINTEYENLLVQNSVESATSFTNLSTNDPKDELYYILKHLIEEDQPVQNMLDKINLFYLYGLLSDEHYFDLLLGGEEGVY